VPDVDALTIIQWIVGGILGAAGAGGLWFLKLLGWFGSWIFMPPPGAATMFFGGVDSLVALAAGVAAWQEDKPLMKGVLIGFTSGEILSALWFFTLSLRADEQQALFKAIENQYGVKLKLGQQPGQFVMQGYAVKRP